MLRQSPYSAIQLMIWIAVNICSTENKSPVPIRVSLLRQVVLPVNKNATVFGDWLPVQVKKESLKGVKFVINLKARLTRSESWPLRKVRR
jgi:hypothetical protein